MSIMPSCFILLCMVLGASIMCSSAWKRCSMCRCRQQGEVLILNCSDLQLPDYDGVIHVPYAGSYEPHFNFSAISAEFRRSGLTSVTILTISRLEKLSLADNLLEELPPFALTRLRNLTFLSVSNNSLTTITKKALDGLENLEILDLSNNKLSFIEPNAFETLKSLKDISLSHNDFTSIPDTVFSLPLLQSLDLSNNSISVLASNSFANIPTLENLSLSHNNITIIDRFSFDCLIFLKTLHLSWNAISFLDDSLFANLNALKDLYLDHNKLEDLNKDLDLPNKLHRLDLSANLLRSVDEIPSSMANLHELILEENFLCMLNFKGSTLPNLRVLKVAYNSISLVTMKEKFPFLEEINLSHNRLEVIPADFTGSHLPALRALYLDQNPLLNIKFPSNEESSTSFVNLTLVSVSKLPRLHELGPNAFTGLSAPCGLGCGNEVCRRPLAVILSHCPRLSSVHPEAFNGVGVCKLDLSYNAFTTLNKDVLNWSIMEKVDLQGNPWDCSCALQWMLDTLLPYTFETHPELLYELRCETPAKLRPWRFVHFLDWPGSVLCDKMEQLKATNRPMVKNDSVPKKASFESIVIILAVAVVVFILMLTVGVIWQRRSTAMRMMYNRRIV